MRIWTTLLLVGASALTACSEPPADTTAPAASKAATDLKAERGGTITVGDKTWQFVPSISCSVYPGPIANLAGHAADDPNLEIVIDHGGPDQVTIGGAGGTQWNAIRSTMQVEVNDRHVTGSATFSQHFGGAGEQAEGSWDIQC